MRIVHGRLRLWLACLALLGTVGCAGSGAGGAPRAGAEAPPLALDTLSSERVSLADLRGRVVIVNFWASWCEPCVVETPRLQHWFEQHQAAGLHILGINTTHRDSQDAVRAFAREYSVTYPVLLDLDGAASERWRIQQLPRSFVVDRQGVVRFVRIGELTERDFEAQIAPLLR